MDTGLVTGPDRSPGLDTAKVVREPRGAGAFHLPEEVLRELLERQRRSTPSVVYYPPDLPTHRREGRLFSAAPRMPDLRALGETHAGQAALQLEALAEPQGVQLELIPVPEEQPRMSLAA
jgi:hypothetical protein